MSEAPANEPADAEAAKPAAAAPASTPMPAPMPESGPAADVIVDVRPHPLDVPLEMLGFAAIVLGVAAGFWYLAGFGTVLPSRLAIAGAAIGLLVARYVWGEIARRCRRHVVTRDRLVVTGGVIRRYRIEIPLARVQHTVVVRRARDRLAGLGSIGFATAGTGAVEAAITGVPDVEAMHARISDVRSA